MNDKLIRQLNREIVEALVSRKFTAVSSRRAAMALTKTPGWSEGLGALFPIRSRLSCTQILQLCAPILDKLCPQPPQQGWGSFCYQYICRTMFPKNGFVPDAQPYEAGARFYLTVLQVLLDHERAALPFDPMMDFQFLSEEE